MLSFEFHPAARDAIDTGAIALLAEVEEHHVNQPITPGFPSERPIKARITDKEIIGEATHSEVDIFGNTVARYFLHDGKLYGLANGAFQNLRRLADQVLKTQWVKEALGRSFVEDCIFLWCRANFLAGQSRPFTEYLLAQAASTVQVSTIWVPIAFMEVEQEFRFASEKLSPITASMLDHYEQKYTANCPKGADDIHALFADKRMKYQGLAAVVVEREGVKDYCVQRAIEIADIVVGLLRLYSDAACVPFLICPITVAGTEYTPSTVAINYGRDGFLMSQRALPPLSYPWRISVKQWESMNANHLALLAELADDSALSEFQNRVRASILTYSRGLMLRELGDRLVYALSALEGLFLRDASEPIQQNLGERLAFLLSGDTEDRQGIVKNIREIYGMRSRYVHHQKSVSEESAFNIFFPIARAALFAALANIHNFPKPIDFINAIDRKKFGG